MKTSKPTAYVAKMSKGVLDLNKTLTEFVNNPAIAGKIKRAIGVRGSKGENKTEALFKQLTEAMNRGVKLDFEAIKFRIGPNCYYCPDYIAIGKNEKVYAYEIKGGGPIRDDSIVKFKAARERYPWVTFQMHRLKAGTWTQIY